MRYALQRAMSLYVALTLVFCCSAVPLSRASAAEGPRLSSAAPSQLGAGEGADAALGEVVVQGSQAVKFRKVEMGSQNAAAISTEDDLYIWGDNSEGQIPGNATNGAVKPVKVMGNVKDVEISSERVLAVTKSGELWAWGYAGWKETPLSPEFVCDHVTQVACNGNGTCVSLKDDGTVWAWDFGYWHYGASDDSDIGEESLPVQVGSSASSVAAGTGNLAYVTKAGDLYMWGKNGYGQILGSSASYVAAPQLIMKEVAKVAISGAGTTNCTVAAIKRDGSMFVWGDNSAGAVGNGVANWDLVTAPYRVMSDVVDMALCYGGAAAIRSDRSLWTWGEGESFGKALVPKKVLDAVSCVAVHEYSGAAVTVSGELKTWGSNTLGLLGTDAYSSKYTRSRIMTDAIFVDSAQSNAIAIKRDKSLWVWGGNSDESALFKPTKIASNVSSACVANDWSGSGDRVFYVTSSGDLWEWRNGYASAKKLAYGIAMVAGGSQHEYSVVTASGDLLSSSKPSEGSYPEIKFSCPDKSTNGGYGYDTGVSLYKLMSNVKTCASGTSYGAAIAKDGSLWMYGRNTAGCLGIGARDDKKKHAPVKVLDGVKAVALSGDGSCTYTTSVALKSDGSVWAWGDDSPSDQLSPVKIASGVKSIEAATYCRVAYVLNDGSCYENTLVTGSHSGSLHRKFDLTGTSIAHVAYSYSGVFHLDSSGAVWAQGKNNRHGLLGNGIPSQCSVPSTVVVIGTPALVTREPAVKKRSFVWNGKVQGLSMVRSPGYDVSGAVEAKNAGSYTATLKLWKGYVWPDGSSADKTVAWKIEKAANTLKVKAKSPSVSYLKLQLKSQKVSGKKAVKVAKAKGKVTYRNVSKSKKLKRFKIAKKSGRITVPRSLGRTVYKLKVKVTAKGNANYKSKSKTVTVRVRVK